MSFWQIIFTIEAVCLLAFVGMVVTAEFGHE